MFIEKHRITYAFNKNIIRNSGGDVGKTIEKLDGNYLETMEKLNIIDTRVRRIFHVFSLIESDHDFTT